MSSPASSPVPFLIARSMFSLGSDLALPASIATRSRAFPAGSPPPILAANGDLPIRFGKGGPRLAVVGGLVVLDLLHFPVPAIRRSSSGVHRASADAGWKIYAGQRGCG